ncbi:MAG: hypothetical protein ACYC61_18945 [Isosphaeraceae bacterium]
MSLTTLVRSIGLLAILWTLAALGIGASGLRVPAPHSELASTVEPSPVDARPANWPRCDRYSLVDRSSGRELPIRLPASDRWTMVRVSPWRGRDGELRAVGRWVAADRDAVELWGWGLFRLSDGVVAARVATDVLPSGRPCWVAGRAPTILYPAADGRIHRCCLDVVSEAAHPSDPDAPHGQRLASSGPLAWGIEPPGVGEVLLDEPSWSDDPRLRRWVFATLRPQVYRGRKVAYGPPQIWWLELSDDGRGIVAAGRVAGTAGSGEGDAAKIWERSPALAVTPDGEPRLVYLARCGDAGAWGLRSGVLRLDPRTRRPTSVIGDANIPAAGPALTDSPLMVSTDGSTAFATRAGGGLAALRLLRDGAAGILVSPPAGANLSSIGR